MAQQLLTTLHMLAGKTRRVARVGTQGTRAAIRLGETEIEVHALTKHRHGQASGKICVTTERPLEGALNRVEQRIRGA